MEAALTGRGKDQFMIDAGEHLVALSEIIDAAYAEFRTELRSVAVRLEDRTKASIIRDLTMRRMREFCDGAKGFQFVRRGNLGVIGLRNNWVLRPKKIAEGFRVAISHTGASLDYDQNRLPLSLSQIFLNEPPATCLYLGWSVPENAPDKIEKYVISNNSLGEIAWVLPLDEFSRPPPEELPFAETAASDGAETTRVRVKATPKRKVNG